MNNKSGPIEKAFTGLINLEKPHLPYHYTVKHVGSLCLLLAAFILLVPLLESMCFNIEDS